MMMRSDSTYTPTEGCSAEELLKCLTADDYDACVAACSGDEEEQEPEVVKAGTLTVSVADYSSEVVAAPRVGTVTLNSINLKASEEITVDTLTLKAAWLTNNAAVQKVWFEKDGVRISSKAGLTSDGTATVNFTKGLTVKSNEKIDLVASFNTATAWSQVTLQLDSVNSTAEKNNISWKTTTYNLINYTVAGVNYDVVTIATATQTYKLWEQNEILFAKIDLENTSNDKAINVKSITFNTNNTNVEKVLDNFTLVRDGKNVAKSATFDGKKVTVTLSDSIEASKTAKYALYAEVKALDNGNETFYLDVDTNDIVAYEDWTNFRTANTPVTAAAPSCTTPINCIVVAGWKIVLTNDSSFATTVNANAGYSDVQIANWTLTVAEPVHFEKLTFADDTATVADANSIKSLKLEIGWKTYNASITRPTGAWTPNTYVFEDIYVNKTSSVKMYVSFANALWTQKQFNIVSTKNIANTNFKSTAGLNTNVWDYQNNSISFDNADIAWTIKVATVSIKDTTFTLKNNLSSTVRSVIADSNSVVLFDGNVSSAKWDVEMSEIIVNGSAIAGTDYLDLTLKVNGKTISTKKYTAWPVSFPINNVKVSSDPVSVVLEAIPHTTVWNGAQTYTLTLAANGTFNGNTATAAAVNAATLQVVTAASLVISSVNQPNQLKLEGNDVEIVKFDVTAQYGNVNLDNLMIDFGTTALTKFDLSIDGWAKIAWTIAATTADACYINWVDTVGTNATQWACTTAKWTWIASGTKLWTINTIDETLSAGAHTLTITANVKDADNANGVGVVVDTDKVLLNKTTWKAISTKTWFVKALPTIEVAKASNLLTLTIKNDSDTAINLTKIYGAWTVSASANGQAITLWTAFSPITITNSEWSQAEVKVSLTAAWLAKISWLTYYVEENWYTYEYDITGTPVYTTFPWWDYQLVLTN